MGEDSAIEQHLKAGRERAGRIGEAVAAFRRLSPADYGHFLATIEDELGSSAPELLAEVKQPLLLAGSSETAVSGSLREAVLGVLADGSARSTIEIRRELEAHREVNRASLNSEIFTMRKNGLLRSEGKGRGTRHAIVSRATSAATSRTSAPGKREPASRAPRRKRDDDDDEDHSRCARAAPPSDAERAPSTHGERPSSPNAERPSPPNAERLYSAAISGHHLLTKAEELELAQRLEDVEIALWAQLIEGALAPEALQLFAACDPPVVPTSAEEARTADLDRLIAMRVIEKRVAPPLDALAAVRSSARAIAREADRIRDRFATCNLRLVPSTIRRHGYHLNTALSMADLIQEGNMGLLKAIPRFDYRRGLRFSTFATWWIRHYLVRARQNLGSEVRIPVHLQELMGKVRKATSQLQKDLGRDPTRAELARTLKVSMQSLKSLDREWPKHREALPSFDSVGVGEEGETPSYLASDDVLADEILGQQEEDGQIIEAIERLPPLLARILRRRFGLGGTEEETLLQIGDSMHLSRERVRQLEKKALAILREKLDEITRVAA